MSKRDFEELARFRFAVRTYLRFSDETVREHGMTPQHYQLLLAIKGAPDREWVSVGELAEQLQLRHHSTVELVTRAQEQSLVERTADPADARTVRVVLTEHGQHMLAVLSPLHRSQMQRMARALTPPAPPTHAVGIASGHLAAGGTDHARDDTDPTKPDPIRGRPDTTTGEVGAPTTGTPQ